MHDISLDERNILLNGASAMIEVCELHSHGMLVEVLLLTSATYITDDEETSHYMVTIGRIGDGHNVTSIGDSYEFDDEARCYVVDMTSADAQSHALTFATAAITAAAMKIDSI